MGRSIGPNHDEKKNRSKKVNYRPVKVTVLKNGYYLGKKVDDSKSFTCQGFQDLKRVLEKIDLSWENFSSQEKRELMEIGRTEWTSYFNSAHYGRTTVFKESA